jgi:ketosteroid isomerase-like protein
VSRQNESLVRRGLDAIIRGDYRAVSECFRDDALWHNTHGFPGPLTYVGPREIIDFWTTLVEQFSVRDPALDPVRDDAGRGGTNIEHIASNDERVVVGLHSVAWGRGSGAPLDLYWGAVFTIDAQKISRVDVHGNWKKALRGAGLAE